MLGGYMRLAAALVYAFLFATTALVGCGGDDSNYGTNLFDDPFSEKKSSSSTKYNFSSSSRNRSSSSVYNAYSSSSNYISNNEQLYSADTTVKKLADLPDSCSDYDRAYVQQNENLYRCMYGKWFQEVKKIPECNEDNEWATCFRNFLYVCQDGEWREMIEVEARVGFCTKEKQGKSATADNVSYICDSLSWKKQTITDVFGECKDSNAGDSIFYSGKSYVCRKGDWNVLSSEEKEYGICTKNRSGEVINENNRYYYICKDYAWISTTKPDDIFGKCNSSKTDSIFRISSSSYVCEGGTWRTATSTETSYGLCNAKRQDSVRTSGSYKYVCDKGTWRLATAEEYYGACTDSLKDIIYTYDSKTYACFNQKWNILPEPPVSSMSYCTKKNAGSMYRTTTTPRTYYHCNNYEWQKIDSLSYTYGICGKDSLGVRKIPHKDSLGYECKETSAGYSWTRLTINDYAACTEASQDSLLKGYVCDNGTWRLQTTLEKSIGLCTAKNNGERTKSGTSYYECASGSWKTITEAQYSLGECTTANDSAIAVYKKVQYLCANQKWITPSVENDTTSCPSAVAGWLVSHKNRIHQCASYNGTYAWRYVGDIAIQEGLCREKNQGKVALMDSTYYICKSNWWYKASLGELTNAIPCGKSFTYNHIKFTCSGDEWTPVYEMMKDTYNGQSYKTLQLGEQTWMVENLNRETADSWCYQNIGPNCNSYGRLYTWDAAQTACPTGWHLPDAYEYNDMLKAISSTAIRDIDYWQQDSYGSSNDFSLFKLRAAGIRFDNGNFEYERRMTGLWYKDASTTNADTAYGYINVVSSTIPEEHYSYSRYHYFEMKGNSVVTGSPQGYRFTKGTGLSVRCVKD